jgi:hypothetical protein
VERKRADGRSRRYTVSLGVIEKRSHALQRAFRRVDVVCSGAALWWWSNSGPTSTQGRCARSLLTMTQQDLTTVHGAEIRLIGVSMMREDLL